jgi:hypothetical protein
MQWNKALTAAFLPQLPAAGTSEANFPGEAYGKEEIICAKIQIVDYGSG